jgi:vacuolar-type H+-ATPase subunit I/STV1
MSKAGRAAITILVAAAVLWLAGWLDGTVMRDIRRQEAATFDATGLSLAYALGAVAVASGVLVFGVLAWRSHSAFVGAVYLVVGAFFAFIPVIFWNFSAQFLPGPVIDAVGQSYQWSYGPLNAVATVGAGMFVVGLLVVGRSLGARISGRRATEPMTGIEGQPVSR